MKAPLERTFDLRICIATIVCASTMVAPVSFGQIIGVRCCVGNDDMRSIGPCVSGPGVIEQPSDCLPSASCVIGFGGGSLSSDLREELCVSTVIGNEIESGQHCVSWGVNPAWLPDVCVAKDDAQSMVAELFDADLDGDLDARDVAAFQRNFSLPEETCSLARLVSAKCCFDNDDLRRIGDCVSGPASSFVPLECGSIGTCTLELNQGSPTSDLPLCLCDPNADTPIREEPQGICSQWLDVRTPVTDTCLASKAFHLNFLSVLDFDEDGDFDLRDLALFQIDFEAFLANPTAAMRSR